MDDRESNMLLDDSLRLWWLGLRISTMYLQRFSYSIILKYVLYFSVVCHKKRIRAQNWRWMLLQLKLKAGWQRGTCGNFEAYRTSRMQKLFVWFLLSTIFPSCVTKSHFLLRNSRFMPHGIWTTSNTMVCDNIWPMWDKNDGIINLSPLNRHLESITFIKYLEKPFSSFLCIFFHLNDVQFNF